MDESILKAMRKLEKWIEQNGYAGFDRYDLRGTPFFLWLQRLPANTAMPFKVIHRLAFSLERRYPLLMRRLFGVKKEINAKAMGLFASAYINFHKTFGEHSYLKKAQDCLNWLEQNPTEGYKGICWGYPFDWQSLHLFLRGTPSSVVSSTVGNAFFEFYKITEAERYLDICKRICEFFINHLNIDRISEDKICFSYTPLDYEHVHNANMFVAEFLIRVGAEIQNEQFMEYGIKALQYTLDQQSEDGAFYYFGFEDKERYNLSIENIKHIDHFHTGFVLRSLLSITERANLPARYTQTCVQQASKALSKGYQYYIDNLFEDEAIPKWTPQSLYPINIHSCSEAILCPSKLSKKFPQSLEIAKKAARWTIENMQAKEGYFYDRIYSDGIISTIPYIRWAQAWMLFALSTYLYEENQ